MKRLISILLALAFVISFASLAEENTWLCLKCGTTNSGKYCSECGTVLEQATAWDCPNCGHSALDTAYCPDCGTKRPTVQVRRNGTCEGNGYDTPQEAAIAYIEALNDGDLSGALSTFAVETFVDNMDTETYLNRIQQIAMSIYMGVPVAGPLSRSLLIEQRRSQITQLIFYGYLYYSVLGTEFDDINDGNIVYLRDEQSITNYVNHMREQAAEIFVGKIHIKGTYLATEPAVSKYVPDQYSTETVQSNIEKTRTMYNGEQLEEVIVLLEIDGNDYVQFMQSICYNGKWYNLSTRSTIATINSVSYFQNGLIEASALNQQ